MALWKDNTAPRQTPMPAPEDTESVRFDAPSKLGLAPSPAAATAARHAPAPACPGRNR